MQQLLEHPAVQAGLAPFVVAFVVAVLLRLFKLGGLAIAAGFATVVLLTAGFEFNPLSTTRKIILIGLLAPLVGMVIDFLAKPGRSIEWAMALACGAITIWVFIAVLKQKEGAAMWILGGGSALFVAWLSGFSLALRTDPARAGAMALSLGLGVGVAAVLGASASFGQYGIALAAAAGAFLLVLVLFRTETVAGATLALPAALTAGLLAAGTLVLASMPWASLALLGLVPLAVRLPIPAKAPRWIKTGVLCVYGLSPATLACWVAWRAASGAAA